MKSAGHGGMPDPFALACLLSLLSGAVGEGPFARVGCGVCWFLDRALQGWEQALVEPQLGQTHSCSCSEEQKAADSCLGC